MRMRIATAAIWVALSAGLVGAVCIIIDCRRG